MTELNQDPTEAAVTGHAPTTLSVGESLRQAREARGETVGEVANALKLTLRQVDAMETNRFELLPGAAFARGFLRNYARHLHVDLDDAISALRFEGEEIPNKLAPISNTAAVMPDSEGASRTFAFMKFCVIVLVLIFLLGWYFDWFKVTENEPALLDTPTAAERAAAADVSQQRTMPAAAVPAVPVPPQPETVPTPVPSDSVMAENAVPLFQQVPPIVSLLPEPGTEAAENPFPAPATATSANAETATADSHGGQLVFILRNSSWIQVRDRDGATLFSGTDNAGTTRKVQGTPPFSLVVGNAPDVTLEFNGRVIDMAPNTHSGVARLTVQ